MNFSTSTSHPLSPRILRVLGAGLSFALVATASGMSVHVRPAGSCPGHFQSRESLGSAPTYLLAVGPAAFRFAPPAPVATERPAPPVAAAPTAVTEIPTTIRPVSAAAQPPKPAENVSSAPVKPGPKPVAILPDDTPNEVRPEDILPFFKLPNGKESTTDVPFTPASPATQPRSSASYELQ